MNGYGEWDRKVRETCLKLNFNGRSLDQRYPSLMRQKRLGISSMEVIYLILSLKLRQAKSILKLKDISGEKQRLRWLLLRSNILKWTLGLYFIDTIKLMRNGVRNTASLIRLKLFPPLGSNKKRDYDE